MKIGLVGAGAIGTIFGASLASAHDVRVLVRDAKTSRAIANRGGLVVDEEPARRVAVTHDPERIADCEIVIVAVKTFATIDALSPLRKTLNTDATIVSIQNGIDAAAQIEYALGHRRAVAVGPTTEAARTIEAGVIKRAGAGGTILGWVAGHGGARADLDALAAIFTQGGLATTAVDDSRPALWGKLVVNAALNPISAIARVTNGEILEQPTLLARASAIATEVADLASREGVELAFADPRERVIEVAKATAPNRTSMLQDVERGRPTELDAILGTVIRRAGVFGLAVPASQTAYDEVRRLTTA